MAIEDYDSLAKERWRRLKKSHFKRQGREERIRVALQALTEAVVPYKPDPEFVRWIAEEGDQED